MQGFSQSDDPLLTEAAIPKAGSPSSEGPGNARERSALEEPELDAALQLLVERAQYITGATGTTLALPEGEEMVCRASAGSCAPAIGARLQVRSGLTSESITRRQLLRCDNAETDPRVNLEACRALGIASIVVLPLLRRNGQVRGLFELFSDHPYAFEERDLSALERMADLTLTALDLAEQRHGTVPPAPSAKQTETMAPPVAAGFAPASITPAGFAAPSPAPPKPAPAQAASDSVGVPGGALPAAFPEGSTAEPVSVRESSQDAPLHETVLHVQKCAACGFPVSEGRTLCLDCDRLDREKAAREKKERENEHVEQQPGAANQPEAKLQETGTDSPTEPSTAHPPDEIVPPFLVNSMAVKESWVSNHVNLLAIVVLILCILVAVVVFR